MDFLDLLLVMFGVHDLTLEYLMTDNAGLAALFLFAGGLFFWFAVLVAAVVGVCRGVKRTYDSAREIFSGRRVETAE